MHASHHEYFNGTGFPDALEGVAIAEAFEELRQGHWRAVRTLDGMACGWLVRQGLMSSPPRRV